MPGSQANTDRESELEDEVARLRRIVDSAGQVPDPPAAQPDWTKAVTTSEDLQLLRLGAPITVVHAMIGSPASSAGSTGIHSESPGSPIFPGSVSSQRPDVVSRGLIGEPEARSMFQS